MHKFKNFFLIVLAFIAGSIVSLGTTLVIAHGGDTNLVHACVRNNTLIPGAANIRIVGENVNCNNNETALDWPKSVSSSGQLPFICTSCDFTSDSIHLQLQQGNYQNAIITRSQFSLSNIDGANFTNTKLGGAEFIQTNFSNTNFTDADIRYSHFLEANLTNINFTNTDLTGAEDFDTTIRSSIIWSNTTCPDGTNSNDNGNTCEGHLTP